MGINVKHISFCDVNSGEYSAEYSAAEELKTLFDKELRQYVYAKGEILILSNITLFGQKRKDLDVLVLGNFNNFDLIYSSKAIDKNNEILPSIDREISIKNICWIFELKNHDNGLVKTKGGQLYVKYMDGWHNATIQSNEQTYALVNYLHEHINFSPFVSNFIWLRNLTYSDLQQLQGYKEANWFSSEFGLKDVLSKTIPLVGSNTKKGVLKSYLSLDLNEIAQTFKLFTQVKKICGELTRKKIERISQKLLDNQNYDDLVGSKLILLAGRAGTGKTMKLLHTAFRMARKEGKRCLILTFNHALVSDIRRTLALADIPDGIDDYTVQVSTLHSFFLNLIKSLGIDNNIKDFEDFNEDYKLLLKISIEYIKKGLADNDEIKILMNSRFEELSWDYIFIDEAQDWLEEEKDLLFTIYGKEKLVVADGVDQFVRGYNRLNWIKQLSNDNYFKNTDNVSLRQKRNLAHFVNAYAERCDINWHVKPNDNFLGGKIYYTLGYTENIHKELLENCKKSKNSPYDILFLVHPNSVAHDNNGHSWFKDLENFEEAGIKLFDGTNESLRCKYPSDLSQCRLFQYDSCRGLEAWTVICLDFDLFFEYKMKYSESKIPDVTMESIDDYRNRFASLWSLMPLTRAIDTLIIQFDRKDSKLFQIMSSLNNEYPDFIQYKEA